MFAGPRTRRHQGCSGLKPFARYHKDEIGKGCNHEPPHVTSKCEHIPTMFAAVLDNAHSATLVSLSERLDFNSNAAMSAYQLHLLTIVIGMAFRLAGYFGPM